MKLPSDAAQSVVLSAPVALPPSVSVPRASHGFEATPVAVKVAGVTPLTVAVSVFAPAVAPRVQPPTVAVPVALDVWEPPVTVPPPLATANVTATPDTTLPYVSATRTLGAVVTAVDTDADWLSPATLVTLAGAPAVPVPVNVAAER